MMSAREPDRRALVSKGGGLEEGDGRWRRKDGGRVGVEHGGRGGGRMGVEVEEEEGR